mmetsp:Transcript_17044/g.14990  ORF Transcript_17044/g.14990 Transcript_17044/m.14990 type:complete len:182 (+) Transcript_17044:364-909(+)
MKLDNGKNIRRLEKSPRKKKLMLNVKKRFSKRGNVSKRNWNGKLIKLNNISFKKSLNLSKNKEMEKLEKIKKRQRYEDDQTTRERIFKREEDLFRKRAELVISKKCVEEEQLMRLERTKFLAAEGKYDKVESRLNKVTKTQKGKTREKFKAGVDDKRDAMTFGGKLTGPSMRAQPAWRKGL